MPVLQSPASFLPAAELSPDLVDRTRDVLVTPSIEELHLDCHPDEMAELLKRKVGARQMHTAVAPVIGIDQCFEYLLSKRLNPIAHQEFLALWKTVKCRDEPQHELNVCFQNRANLF